MRVRIGLENGIEGRSLAWALDHPGCFAYGPDGQSAVFAMSQSVPHYIQWMASRTDQPWFNPPAIDIRLVEIWEVYQINERYEEAESGYEVNAWFRDDWRPLSEVEIERGLHLLAWSRADLLATIASAPAGALTHAFPNELWTIEGIAGHVGSADWWYLNRLGLGSPRSAVPKDPWQRLLAEREALRAALPGLAGVAQVVGKDGEFWSPRKLLRRAVWHELDHILHIRRLFGEYDRLPAGEQRAGG